MSLIPGERPLDHAPSLNRRQLVPWMTSADLDILDEVEFGPDVMLFAQTLGDAHFRPSLSRRVRERLKVGLLLEPETYLLQLDAERRAKDDVADRVGLLLEGRDGRHLDLTQKQRPQTLAAFARHVLDAEVRALATALVAPAPLLGERDVVALNNAALLLDASASYFVSESLDLPADTSLPYHVRQLFAAITLDVRTLRDAWFLARALERFADAPSPVYGFLVQVANLSSHPQPRDVRVFADFVYALEARSGRPVVPARVGCLGVGFLAGGVAGYSVGPGVSELLRFPPLPFRPRDDVTARSRGFSIVSYHPRLLRNVRTLGPNSGAGRLAFFRIPCSCGFHEIDKPPHSNHQRKAHNLWWRITQARKAVAGGATWLLDAVAAAEAASVDIDGETEFYAALRETLPAEGVLARLFGGN